MLTAAPPLPTLGRVLRARYGRPLRRVMLDLGLSCPNRDGLSGYGGCIYCDVHGSGTGAAPRAGLDQQWRRELARVRRKIPDGPAAIAYFQSYSNTYPQLAPLARALEFCARRRADAPIVSVATRPDCFGAAAAALLASYRDSFDEVWVELGLESADDEVQRRIQRHDRLANFHAACALARRHGLRVICHTIAGLPGERADGLLRQAEEAARAGVHGIKFHQLMVLRRTKLEQMWRRGEVELLAAERYVEMVVQAIERLPAGVVLHRLAAAAPAADYLAPLGWPPYLQLHAWIEREALKGASRARPSARPA